MSEICFCPWCGAELSRPGAMTLIEVTKTATPGHNELWDGANHFVAEEGAVAEAVDNYDYQHLCSRCQEPL